MIDVAEVEDEQSNLPVERLSGIPSGGWRKAFESVIRWTNQKGDKTEGLGDPLIPDNVKQGKFKIAGDRFCMTLIPGKQWADVRAFTEDVAIAYANRVVGA